VDNALAFGRDKFYTGVMRKSFNADAGPAKLRVCEYPSHGVPDAISSDSTNYVAGSIGGCLFAVESQKRALGAAEATANAGKAKCFAGAPKKPSGPPRQKFVGRWSCIVTGAVDGNATLIFFPGAGNKVDVTAQQFYRGYAPRTLQLSTEQHGSSLWREDDDLRERYDLQSGTIRRTQVSFDGARCNETTYACTR
jgi:hypothetical protein